MAGPGNHQTQRFPGTVTALPGQNLWRHILGGADDGETGFSIAAVARESEIGKLDNHSLTITIC